MSDLILDWYNKDTYTEHLERVRRFWQGDGRFLISMPISDHPYRQTFDDRKMLETAPLHLRDMAQNPGVNLPCFYPDFGTISTAKYWGGNYHFDSTGGNIFIEPAAQTIEEALKLAPLPVDHPDMDAAHGTRLFKELCEQLQTDALWLRTTDFQGALNTAGLIMNQEELLMAMYSQPDEVHAFLNRICDFLIDYSNYFIRETNGMVCGNIWPDTFFPAEFGMAFTEDMMPLLSPDLYREFGIPCLKRFEQAFGGLHIHCCGDWGRHAPALREVNVAAIEFHYPATTIEEIACLAGNTVFIPFLMQDRQHRFTNTLDYYRCLIEETNPACRYWFILYEDTPETREFIEKYTRELL